MDAAGIAAVLTALAGFVAALGAFIVSLRNGGKLNEVRVVMDGRLDDALREIRDLRREREDTAAATRRERDTREP